MNNLNRIEIKEKARKLIKGKLWEIWKPLLIIGLIAFILTVMVNTFFTKDISCDINLLEIFPELECKETSIIGQLINFVMTFITVILYYGFIRYILKFVRKEKYDLKEDLFKYFKQDLILCILVSILISLFTTLWALLLIIPGIIASLSYSQSIPLVVDGKYTRAMDVINDSKKMMYGHKKDYFVFELSFIGWMLFVLITFGIGLIYVGPYITTANILYYEELKKLQSKEKE